MNFLSRWRRFVYAHTGLAELILISGTTILFFYGIWETGSYLPDERNTVVTVGRSIRDLDLLISYFRKGGTFHVYLVMVTTIGAYLIASIKALFTGASVSLSFEFILVVARIVSGVFGLIVVLLTVGYTRMLADRHTSLYAGFAVASMYGLALFAHSATEDTLMIALLLATLYGLSWYQTTGQIRIYYAAAVGAGLAVSAKAPAGALTIPLIYFGLFRKYSFAGLNNLRRRVKAQWTRVVKAGGIAALSFLLTTPALPFAFEKFISKHTYNLARRKGSIDIITSTYQYHLTNIAVESTLPLGIFLSVCALLTLRTTFTRTQLKPILLFAIPYFLIIGSWSNIQSTYIIPLLPLLVISAAVGLNNIRSPTYHRASVGVLVIVVIFAGVHAGTGVYSIYGDNTRENANQWLETNIDDGASIDIYETRGIYHPAFPAYANITEIKNISQAEHRIICGMPDYVILIESNYRAKFRAGVNRPVSETHQYRLLHGDFPYTITAHFGKPVQYKYSYYTHLTDGIELNRQQDMLSPTIIILEQTGSSIECPAESSPRE